MSTVDCERQVKAIVKNLHLFVFVCVHSIIKTQIEASNPRQAEDANA